MAEKKAFKTGLKKGDTVIVIAGKDKGKKGKILSIMHDASRSIVERVNVVKKHNKPNRKLKQAGILDIEAPIDNSNLMLVCGKCNTPTRIGRKLQDDETKVRVCKKCGADID